MRKLNLVVLIAIAFLIGMSASQANARVIVGIGVGGCCVYGPAWGYPYPAYYYPPPYYPAPAGVVYAPAPAYPSTVYVTPSAYAAPSSLPAVQANQTSPTFVDSYGRTCRQFQSTSPGPAYGTACLQSDGSWKVME